MWILQSSAQVVMWGVSDCVNIETGVYKVFGGHVAGDWEDVSKYSTLIRVCVYNRPCLDLVGV